MANNLVSSIVLTNQFVTSSLTASAFRDEVFASSSFALAVSISDGSPTNFVILPISSSYSASGSSSMSASLANFANLANSASFATFSNTSSLSNTASFARTSSLANTSSFANFASTSSLSNTSSFSNTASFARLSGTSSYLSGSVIATGSFTVDGLVAFDNLLWSAASRKLKVCQPFSFAVAPAGGGPVSTNFDGPGSWIGTLGTAANSRVQAILLQNLTGVSTFSGQGIDFSKKVRFAPTFAQNIIVSGSVLRFVACGDNVVRNGDTATLVQRGIGVELRGSGSGANGSGSVSLFAHNGTTYVTSSKISYSPKASQFIYGFILESTGTGTVNLYWDESSGSMPSLTLTPALTMSGGPTNAQTISASFLHTYIAQATAGSSTTNVNGVKAILYQAFWQTVN